MILSVLTFFKINEKYKTCTYTEEQNNSYENKQKEST